MLGDRVHAERPFVGRLMGRAKEVERRELLKTHREPVSFSVRASRDIVNPGAHAPQLIRLVRHPYPMEPVSWKRLADSDRRPPERPERELFQSALRAAVEDGRRLPFPRPTESHPPLPTRSRPDLQAWLVACKGGRQ